MKRQKVAVVVAALGACVFSGRALAQASGVIAAGPNPCVIEPGKSDCASYLTWTTQGVARATVYVTAEGKTNIRPREFSASPSCELTRCPAPWIEPDTKYVFTLYDSSADSPGNALSSVTVTASAVTPSGSIAASPNPCVIEPGKADCASYITWSTENVAHAAVYLTVEGRKAKEPSEFSGSRSCEGTTCSAPWIERDTKYVFTLHDTSSGTRGRALASVTVTASSVTPSGTIAASPNPCVVGPGRAECTSYITWSTENVAHAAVYVTAEGNKTIQPREFSGSRSCESTRCSAPWIEAETRYVFTLYDTSSGTRGRALGSVTVTANRSGR